MRKNNLILGKVGDGGEGAISLFGIADTGSITLPFGTGENCKGYSPRILSKSHRIPDAAAGWRAQTVEPEKERAVRIERSANSGFSSTASALGCQGGCPSLVSSSGERERTIPRSRGPPLSETVAGTAEGRAVCQSCFSQT